MAYVVLTERPASMYWDDVHCATVGDDNVAGVSEEIIDKFNMVSIKELYSSWGYNVTPASKGSVVLPYITIEEATFVKRRFVESEFGYIAPLEVDSIWKPFAFERVDAGVTKLQRLHDVALGAQHEAFLHGKKFRDEFVAEIEALFRSHGLGQIVVVPWEEMVNKYEAKEFRTFAL